MVNKRNENGKGKIVISDVFANMTMDDKTEVRVSRTIRENENVCCLDIRLFKLYPIAGNYDNNMKATHNGITLSLDRLPELICSLHDMYYDEFGKDFNYDYYREEN